jgi:hypothetical protein
MGIQEFNRLLRGKRSHSRSLQTFSDRSILVLLLIAALTGPITARAQQRVDPHFTYHRIYCVVPLTGSGNAGDPIRPEYVPVPGSSVEAMAHPSGTSGIIAFYHETSDDGKWALAEIVARDRASLAPILADKRPGVWAAEKGTITKAELYTVFSRFKKTINLDHFGVAVR